MRKLLIGLHFEFKTIRNGIRTGLYQGMYITRAMTAILDVKNCDSERMSGVVCPLVDNPLQSSTRAETIPLPPGNGLHSEITVSQCETNVPECAEKFRIFSIGSDAVLSTYSPKNVIVYRPKVVRDTKIFSISADCVPSSFTGNVNRQRKAAEKISVPEWVKNGKIFSIQADSVLSASPCETQNVASHQPEGVENSSIPKRAKGRTRFSTDDVVHSTSCSIQNVTLYQPESVKNSSIPQPFRSANGSSIQADGVLSTNLCSTQNVVLHQPEVVKNSTIPKRAKGHTRFSTDDSTSFCSIQNVTPHRPQSVKNSAIPEQVRNTTGFSIQADHVLPTVPSSTQSVVLHQPEVVKKSTIPKRAKGSTRFSTDDTVHSTTFCSVRNVTLHRPEALKNSVTPKPVRIANIVSATNSVPLTPYATRSVVLRTPKMAEKSTIRESSSNVINFSTNGRVPACSSQKVIFAQPKSTGNTSTSHNPVKIPKIDSVADYSSSTASQNVTLQRSKPMNDGTASSFIGNTKIFSIKSDAVLPSPLPVQEISSPPSKPIDSNITSNVSDTASSHVMKKKLVPTLRKINTFAFLKLRKNKKINPRSKKNLRKRKNKNVAIVNLPRNKKGVTKFKAIGRNNTSNFHRFVKKAAAKRKNKNGAVLNLPQNAKLVPRSKAKANQSNISNLPGSASLRVKTNTCRKRKINRVATSNSSQNTNIVPPSNAIDERNVSNLPDSVSPRVANNTSKRRKLNHITTPNLSKNTKIVPASKANDQGTTSGKIDNVATPNLPQNVKTEPPSEAIDQSNTSGMINNVATPSLTQNIKTEPSSQNTKAVPRSKAIKRSNASNSPDSARPCVETKTSRKRKINNVANPNLSQNTKIVPRKTSNLPANNTSKRRKLNDVPTPNLTRNTKALPPSKTVNRNNTSNLSGTGSCAAKKTNKRRNLDCIDYLNLLKNTIVPQPRPVILSNTASHCHVRKPLAPTTKRVNRPAIFGLSRNGKFGKAGNNAFNSSKDDDCICDHQECMNNRLKKIHFVKAKKQKKKKIKNIHNVRKWENPFAIKTNPKSGFVFSVMSYNVLAQDLIYQHAYLYRNHDQDSLNWDVRWKNLLQEIKDTDPDIMCLQEVQETHIQNYFSTLSSLGYEGIYKKRTGVRVDGCAIYYKKDNVTALEHTTVEYRQPDVPLLDRDNVGLVVKFAPKLHPTKEFVVATTHLLYNPRREDVRLAQAQLLLTEVERISYKRNNINKGDSYLPVIITGDFNALPDSNLFKFISTGELHYNELAPQLLDHKPNGPVLVTTTLGISDNCQHVDLLVNRNNNITVPRSEELKLIKLCSTEVKKEQCSSTQARQHFSSGTLSHNFQLRSVYDNQKGTTNQDGRWIVVDYIFYSTLKRSKHGKLHPLARYGLPQRRRLKHITIPNKDVGSDHFSLIVKFKLD